MPNSIVQGSARIRTSVKAICQAPSGQLSRVFMRSTPAGDHKSNSICGVREWNA